MKYYRDMISGEVFAYDTAIERECWGSETLVEMTSAEVAAHLNPEPNPEKQAEIVRRERDRRLSETDYMMLPDYPIGEAQRASLETYRQALRDVPQQSGFPELFAWPQLPKLE